MYGYEKWTIKKAECQRIDAFELWCWRRPLRVPWTARRSNHSILKEISPGCSLEGLMLKLKLQYFGHLMQRTDSLEKTLMLGKLEGGRRGRQRMRCLMASLTRWTWVWVNSWSLLKLKFIESVMPSNHLILCIPLLLPSIFLKTRVFSSESGLCIRWPKYWSFSFNISPSNEYSGLISFRIDWLDLRARQRTLKSLLQYHNSKASILQCLALWSNFHMHIHLLEKP